MQPRVGQGQRGLLQDTDPGRHGAQGPYDGASKAALENEFGTSVDEEVVKQILEKGTLKESQVRHSVLFPPRLW